MMAGTHRRPHAIMIPYPYQGHINPFVYLAMKLASQGFTITFVNTQSVHYRISRAQTTIHGADIFTKARESGLDIRYATVSDGFPLSFDRSLNHDQFVEGLLHVFSAHVDELVADLVKSDPPVTCLIADTFYVWTSEIARKHNLVSVSFWTEPALVLSLYYHLDLLKKNGHFASDENRKDVIDYIPGVAAIKPTDLMSYLQAADIWTVVHRVIYRAFEDVKKADIIICNTVQDLESQTIMALHRIQPTYAIGPIVSGFTNQTVATSLWSESDCTQWLNSKPDGSVLYVSFGSHAHTTSKQDIWEIAHGLLMSGVNFLWVIRPDIVCSEETDFLPAGFENNMKGKGLIIQWCSQIKVISHRAIGGFLSHCGWNSVLESIWCGIPLICFPLFTDQFTNRKLVVNDWKIGINLCDEPTITREEVAEKIKYLMSGKSSEELRNAIMEVRRTLKNALPSEGSSEKIFNLFIDEIQAQIKKKAGQGIELQDQSTNHVWVPNAHLKLLQENGQVPVDGVQENVDYIPRIPSINTKDFMSYFQDSESDLLHKAVFRAFDLVRNADFILCNTVQELEAEAISVLQQKLPFYTIGPLFPVDFSKNLVPRSLLQESDCMEWLNVKPPGSVLYVSFGSLAKTDRHVILEIAKGILLSEVYFIWVLQPGIVTSDGDGIFPVGFEHSVKNRGIIVQWCNQNLVLSNLAIGGFLTHCGWNSILESIWCEVPVICYPLFTDQPTNRKLLVDDWKIGINLCDRASITREEVAEKIGSLMCRTRSEELRQEIKKLRKILQNALAKDGSSEKNFDCFLHDLTVEKQRRRDNMYFNQ